MAENTSHDQPMTICELLLLSGKGCTLLTCGFSVKSVPLRTKLHLLGLVKNIRGAYGYAS